MIHSEYEQQRQQDKTVSNILINESTKSWKLGLGKGITNVLIRNTLNSDNETFYIYLKRKILNIFKNIIQF